MASFGGFEMETPQEVLARLDAQRRQVMARGDVSQQRTQNIESALDNLFGTPQARAAARNVDAIKRATASVGQPQAGEDDLSYEMRRLKTLRDAVADVDPATAAQINTQLLQIGEAKFQRDRLKSHDQQQTEEHNLAVDQAKDEATVRKAYGGQTYVLDKGTGNAQGYNLRDPNENAAFLEAAQKPNTIVITPAQAAQIYMNDSDNAAKIREALARADAGGGSKVEQQRLEQASGSLIDLYATADRIFQVFDENPDAITGSAKGGQALDRLATELGAVGRLATGTKLKDSDLSIDDWFKANSITSTRMQGLVIGLAYATAKANDPSGRISDKDLIAAVQMIGGDNPNPAAILANLNDNITARSNALIDRIGTSTPAAQEALKGRLALLKDRSAAFKKRMAKYATGTHGPGATGIDVTGTGKSIDQMTPDELEQWAQQQGQ